MDTTRESADLSAELIRQRQVIEDQTGRLLQACGQGSVTTYLVVALTEGSILNLVVQNRAGIAAGTVDALVDIALQPDRHRR